MTAAHRYIVPVLEFLQRRGIDRTLIDKVVTEPHRIQDTPVPQDYCREIRIREDVPWAAACTTDEATGETIVLSVRPPKQFRPTMTPFGTPNTPQGPRARSGGPKRAALDSTDELVRRARACGLDYELGGRASHGKIHDPKRPQLGFVVVPTTPSDTRSLHNAAARIRRTFSVTL